MDKYTIENINLVLLAFAIIGIWVWLLRVPSDPLAIWRLSLAFLILITIDRYKEIKYERQLRR